MFFFFAHPHTLTHSTISTLATTPLFQFPALPTLDAHFIFQIKLMCRESMVVSLLKTASELEVYAREFELSCSNLEQLLRPTFDNYKIEPPPLPTPLPLTAYPFDFQPPEGTFVFDWFDVTKHQKMVNPSRTLIRHISICRCVSSMGSRSCKSNGFNSQGKDR